MVKQAAVGALVGVNIANTAVDTLGHADVFPICSASVHVTLFDWLGTSFHAMYQCRYWSIRRYHAKTTGRSLATAAINIGLAKAPDVSGGARKWEVPNDKISQRNRCALTGLYGRLGASAVRLVVSLWCHCGVTVYTAAQATQLGD